MNGYYSQDVIKPDRIEHGFEFMLATDGNSMEFMYNFLDYQFVRDNVQVRARHYLDEPHDINLNISSIEALRTPLVEDVLIVLGMRYGTINWLSDEGYVPIPKDIEEALGQRVEVHVRAHGRHLG